MGVQRVSGHVLALGDRTRASSTFEIEYCETTFHQQRHHPVPREERSQLIAHPLWYQTRKTCEKRAHACAHIKRSETKEIRTQSAIARAGSRPAPPRHAAKHSKLAHISSARTHMHPGTAGVALPTRDTPRSSDASTYKRTREIWAVPFSCATRLQAHLPRPRSTVHASCSRTQHAAFHMCATQYSE
jgi:hypothetical protein